MKNNRKGFTTVELVIVIAVIAILAAVLIPTFTGLIEKANDSSALQEARNTLTNYMIDHAQDSDVELIIKADDKHFYVVDKGNFKLDSDGEVKVYPTYAEAKGAVAPSDTNYEWPADAPTGDYATPVEKDNG